MTRISVPVRSRSISALFVVLLALGACGSSSSRSPAATDSGATTPSGTKANTLTIQDRTFSALTVKAGDAISIVNADSVDHTVTADDGSFDVAAPASSTATLTITKAGTYAIHCKIHSTMHGTIVVT